MDAIAELPELRDEDLEHFALSEMHQAWHVLH